MNIENIITKKINKIFSPSYFKLINFSEKHRHHETNNRTNYSHIKLVIVSQIFKNLNRVDRERKVHELLTEELKDHVHALVLKLYSEDESKLTDIHNFE